MSPLSALCTRRQFQLYLVAGLCLSQYRAASGSQPAVGGAARHLVHANNAFALSLLRDVEAHGQNANQFFSPFSIESALSIVLEGARNETAREMGQVLGYPSEVHGLGNKPWDTHRMHTEFQAVDKRLQPAAPAQAQAVREELNRLRKQLQKANDAAQAAQRKSRNQEADAQAQEARKLAKRINQLADQVDQYELYNANSLWLDASYPLSKKYQSIVDKFYGSAGAFDCDFQHQPDAERQRINRWVGEHTRSKINDIIPPGALTTLTRLVIANAIYFKGTWSQPFDAGQTKATPFTTSALEKTKTQLMSRHGFDAGRYAAFRADGSLFETPRMVDGSFQEDQGYPDADGFQIAELPYQGDALSMMVLLPRRADGLGELLQTLTAEKLHACAEHLEQRTFHVGLPKFKLETTYSLNEPLQRLGMKQAFDPEQADFSGMTDSRRPEHELHVSLVLHKAHVDVNEQGTEAAAATIVAMDVRAAPVTQRPFIPSFTADHPFLFVIREQATGLILFIGKVEQP